MRVRACVGGCTMLETISKGSPDRGIHRRADWLTHGNTGSTLLNGLVRISPRIVSHPL